MVGETSSAKLPNLPIDTLQRSMKVVAGETFASHLPQLGPLCRQSLFKMPERIRANAFKVAFVQWHATVTPGDALID